MRSQSASEKGEDGTYAGADAAVTFTNRRPGLGEQFRPYAVCDSTAMTVAIVNFKFVFGYQVAG